MLSPWRSSYDKSGTLPLLELEDDCSALALLVAEREAAVAEATRLSNQVHALLFRLDSEYKTRFAPLHTKAGLRAVVGLELSAVSFVERELRASIVRLGKRLLVTTKQVDEVAARIRSLAADKFGDLTAICRVNLLTAGSLAAHPGPGNRFRSEAQLAAYAGVAPLEASSAGNVRHRLSRQGNRRLNAVVHRIAVSQARHSPEARTYLARRRTEGKSKREAFRALKRYIVRAIYNAWLRCDLDRSAPRATLGRT
jgi:transposase